MSHLGDEDGSDYDYQFSEEGSDVAYACDLLFRAKLSPTPSIRSDAHKKSTLVITSIAFCESKQRLYYGLNSGDVCFWPLRPDGVGAVRYVGSHKGPVTCICIPRKEDGELGASGLILTASVDGNIKIWDYQGKVMLEPTVCVQTLYGHSGTVTGLFAYSTCIVSSSTDRTVKVWKAVEGRAQLVYPWYDLQATVATLDGWVRSMSYDRSKQVGDQGTFYAVDEAGAIVRILPDDATLETDGKRVGKGITFTVDTNVPVGTGTMWPPTSVIRKVHDRGVLLVRYVANWELLLTLCYDNALRAYDTASGELKHEWFNENRCLFTDMEVDQEFSEVVVGDKVGVLAIFSLKAGALTATKRVATSPIVRVCAVLGRQVYAVVTETELSVWHLNHELDYNMLRGGHTRAVVSIYACSGGSGANPNEADFRIFSASVDNTLRLWDPYDMACVRVMEERASEISAMVFYEAWNILVTGHDNGDIRLWDLDTGSASTLKQHTNSVTSLTLALMRRNEELLISGAYDGLVVLWDIRSLRNEPPHMIARFRAHGVDPVKGSLAALSGAAGKATPVTPASARQPPAGGSSHVGLWEQGSGIPPITVRGSQAGTSSVEVQAGDGCALQAGGVPVTPGGTAVGAGGSVLTILALEPEVLVVRYDPVKKVIITAGNDRTIKVWSSSGYYLLGQHLGHTDAVSCLALDANLLFSGSEDTTIRVWDTVPASHAPPSTTLATPSSTGSVAAGGQPVPDGSMLGFIGRPLKVLSGHTRCVTALDVNPATGHLVSVSLDGSLRFWDYVAGTVLHKFAHHEEFRCMALRFDKSEVLVGTSQASILRFPAPEPIQVAPVATSATQAGLEPSISQTGSVSQSGAVHELVASARQPPTPEGTASAAARGIRSMTVSSSDKERDSSGGTWRYGAGKVMLPKKPI